MKNIKETIIGLEDYFVPQDFSRVKLNQNESPYDIPTELKKKIFQRLMKVEWSRYPIGNPESLIAKISGYTGFPATGIMVGNSSNELIQTVIYSICNTGDKILVIKPGFSIYKRVASIMNVGVVEIPLLEDFTFDVKSIINKAPVVRLIMFASPNNPTGTVLELEYIEKIVKGFNGFVVVDEAYFEFYRVSAQEIMKKYNNLIVIRTFSKAMGLAGIRLGYMLGEIETIKQLKKAKLPFSVGFFQQVVGEVILENSEFIKKNGEKIINERKRVMKEMGVMEGIHPVPSHSNFILFQSEFKSAENLFRSLFDKGVVLRNFKAPELKNWLRITIGSRKDNDFFLLKLREVVLEEKK